MATEARDTWSLTLLLIYLRQPLIDHRGRYRESLSARPSGRSPWPRNPATLPCYMIAASTAYLFYLLGEYAEGLAQCDRCDRDRRRRPHHRGRRWSHARSPRPSCIKGGILTEQGRARRGPRDSRSRTADGRRAGRHRNGRLGPHVERQQRVSLRRPRARADSTPSRASRSPSASATRSPDLGVVLDGPSLGAWAASGDRRSTRSSARRRSPRERLTGVDADAWSVVWLAEAHLGPGRPRSGQPVWRAMPWRWCARREQLVAEIAREPHPGPRPARRPTGSGRATRSRPR